MGIGDVKDLIVRFFAKDWESVKAKIDSIPDEKDVTVKVDVDRSSFSAALADLAAFARSMDTIERSLGGGGSGGRDGGFLSRLFFRGFGGINLPGPLGSLPSFFTSLPGLAVLAGAIGAAVSAVVALVNGFAAAGAGAVAFGLLARPTFTAVSTALTNLATDTAAYQAATTATAKSDALKKIKADWAALDPAQKAAVKGVQKFQDAWATAAQKFEPTAMKIFGDLLAIANQLLPVVSQLATPFANALDPLLKKLDTFLKSPGFQDWLKKFSSLIGPATGAIGNGLGRTLSDIGKLMTLFSGKDVAHAINIFFDIVNAAIRTLTWVVNTSRTAWDWITQKAIPAIKHAWDNVSHAIDNIRHAFDNIGHAFDNFMHAVGNVNHAIDNVRHFFAVAGVDIWHAIYAAFSKVGQVFTVDIPHWISIGIAWFKSLPGRILSAVGNLGHLLFSAGASIIHGLIAGIQSALGGLMSIMGHVAGIIGSFLPNSPEAKVGPLSGYGGLENRGRSISEFLARGITAGSPSMNAAMSRLAGGIAGGIGVRAVGTSGGNVYITVHGFVGSEHQLAMQIQQSLLALKRRRFGVQGNTAAGLGLA